MSSVQRQPSTPRLLGGRYEVASPLGEGAQANVFRVRDLRSGAMRAAKVLKTELAANPEILARFEDEFRILRTLHHPHLPDVFDYGWTDDGGRYLVMELVEGEPLDQYFRAHPADIWVILYELCETLVFVHARNLLHQDIKPSNILVSRAASNGGERPTIKLIDFGLTHRRGVEAAVRLVGTADYIAPEVVRGDRSLTRAVDYYSLGATMFEMLTGAPPFSGTESEVLRAHLEREPVIENEEIEWAELYPHVRGLLLKDSHKRLTAFEDLRRTVVGRLTGGIDDLDRSYALARIDSLGMIGKRDAWEALLRWMKESVAPAAATPVAAAHTFSISGSEGVGKRFLTSAFRAEASIRGLRTVAPADIGLSDRGHVATRQPALMWSRLLEMCEREPVVLVVERPMSLPDEERSFVRLAGTQWELFRSRGRVLPLFFLVAVDSTSDDAETLDYLPSDAALKFEVATLDKDERAQIVEQFRGAMFDPRDARALGTYLERFDDCGSAVESLQRAVLRGGLTFLGQRWKVQPGLLTEIVESSRDDSFARDLVTALSPLERSVAVVVAAHPDPVPLSWVGDFVSMAPDALPSILAGPLRRLIALSTDTVAPVNKNIRAALLRGSEVAERQRAHEFLAEHVVRIEGNVASDRSLAYHYQQLGRVRDAARVHLRLLRAYWAIRPRERPYELIEGMCRSGLELLEAHGDGVSRATRRHLFCFYLKQWINAFWARNLFTHAKPVIDEWTKRLKETMPASVAPRYVRSVLEREGPAEGVAILFQLSALPLSRQLRARLRLEQALCLHYLGQYEQALAVISAQDMGALSPKDAYRLQIYRAMNMSEVGSDKAARELVTPIVGEAERGACIDESLVMHALIARSLLMEGKTVASLAAAARGLRLALGAGLSSRANTMYRMASTAYEELGDARRSQQCQEKAIQLADAVGMRDMSGASWSRLGTAERKAGRYGNAIKNLRRAVSLIGEHGPAWSRLQALVGLYGVLVLVQCKTRTELESMLTEQLRGSKEENTLGYFSCWRGRDLEHHGKFTSALDSYHQGTKYFRMAGSRSNTAWGMSHEARIQLRLGNLQQATALLAGIEAEVALIGSREATFELNVLRLKEAFLSRSPWRSMAPKVEECEAGLKQWQTASSRVEALRLLFRVYSRRNMATDAADSFGRYRELVLEMSSNLNVADPSMAMELSDVGEMLEEFTLCGRVPYEK